MTGINFQKNLEEYRKGISNRHIIELIKTPNAYILTREVKIPYGSRLVNQKVGNIQEENDVIFLHYHNSLNPSDENRRKIHKKMKFKPQIYVKIAAKKQDKIEDLCRKYNLQ